jgi:hypothetical protein
VASARALAARPDHPLVWELEAWLLTEEPPAAIAGRLGLSVGSVRAYEALFYNVRDRRDADGFLRHVAIGAIPIRGLPPRRIDLLWKLAAFHGGARVLDALVAPVRELFERRLPLPGVADLVGLVLGGRLDAETVAAAWTVRPDARTSLALVRSYLRDRRRQRREPRRARRRQEAAEGEAKLRTHIQAFVAETRRVAGDAVPFVPARPEEPWGLEIRGFPPPEVPVPPARRPWRGPALAAAEPAEIPPPVRGPSSSRPRPHPAAPPEVPGALPDPAAASRGRRSRSGSRS